VSNKRPQPTFEGFEETAFTFTLEATLKEHWGKMRK
jgi:hypothetical protein